MAAMKLLVLFLVELRKTEVSSASSLGFEGSWRQLRGKMEDSKACKILQVQHDGKF